MGVEPSLAVRREVALLRQVLPQKAVSVLVRAALPKALGVAEVDLHVGHDAEALVRGQLGTAVPGERVAQLAREGAHPPPGVRSTVAASLPRTSTSIMKH